MKKFNLFLLVLLLAAIEPVLCQQRHISGALKVKKHFYHQNASKPITDTIMPQSFSGSCLDSLKLYYADQAPHDSGWICGTNGWQDKEKAMKFYLGNATVTGAIPFFGIRKGTNGTVYAKIYTRDATTKGPGTLLATSNGIAMSAIDTFNSGINFRNVFHFTPAISVTDTFFISFTLPTFVNNNTELGLISESINCSRPYRYNAWEQWYDNTWHSFFAAYNANIDMAIFPVINVPNTQNDILTFYMSQQTSPATVNPSLHQVFIQVSYGTDITSLSPTITVSPYATISPLSNTPQNFSGTFTYNVMAENGVVQPWQVLLSIAPQPSSQNDILTFTMAQLNAPAVIDATSHTVNGQVAHGVSRTSLRPTITVSAYATINPSSGVVQNFTNPVAYTVTAQDGTPQNWIVTITEAPLLRHGNNILTFTLSQLVAPAIIDTNSHYISALVTSGTDRSNLTPTITVSPGATISPLSGTTHDFTNPFAYTVTSEDNTPQNWVVSVSEELDVKDVLNTIPIQIIPNPSDGVFYLKSAESQATYAVYNMFGDQIKTGLTSSGNEIVNLSNAAKGIYFVKISKGNRVSFRKVVIQ